MTKPETQELGFDLILAIRTFRKLDETEEKTKVEIKSEIGFSADLEKVLDETAGTYKEQMLKQMTSMVDTDLEYLCGAYADIFLDGSSARMDGFEGRIRYKIISNEEVIAIIDAEKIEEHLARAGHTDIDRKEIEMFIKTNQYYCKDTCEVIVEMMNTCLHPEDHEAGINAVMTEP